MNEVKHLQCYIRTYDSYELLISKRMNCEKCVALNDLEPNPLYV